MGSPFKKPIQRKDNEMKLLDTGGNNTKLRKTNNAMDEDMLTMIGEAIGKTPKAIRLAGLSLAPSDWACPASKLAGCREPCLMSAGFGKFDNVRLGRERKRDWLRDDPTAFLDQLTKELHNFDKLTKKQGVQGVARLNVISDVVWEGKYEIPQQFPSIFFYDYTKISGRLGKTPKNYPLMFSWSGMPNYQRSVDKAMQTDAPMAVVFDCPFPKEFLGRAVFDGDKSDLLNLTKREGVIALKAKGDAKGSNDPFVVSDRNANSHLLAA